MLLAVTLGSAALLASPLAFTFHGPQTTPRGAALKSIGSSAAGTRYSTSSGASAFAAGSCIAAAAVAVVAASSRRSRVACNAAGAEDLERRQVLASALGVVAVAAPAVPVHAIGGIFGESPGPFERDPKDAVLVEDPNTPEAKEAKQVVQDYKKQNDKALSLLKADQQANIDFLLANKVADLAILRKACGTIDKLMDDRTANGTRLLGRQMTQARYLILDEAEFPLNRKGEPVGRGPARRERLIANMEAFSEKSGKLLAFVP